MTNPYIPDETPLAPGDLARSGDLNTRYEATVAAFDKLPVPASGKRGFGEPVPVGEPVNADDAATKGFVETGMTSQVNVATTQAGIATTKAAEAAADRAAIEAGNFARTDVAETFESDVVVNGDITLGTNDTSAIKGRMSGGAARALLVVDADDVANLGNTNTTLRLQSNADPLVKVGAAADEIIIHKGNAAENVVEATSSTGAGQLPTGTTAQRPAASTGMFRFNTTDTAFEGYNGTSWDAIGGADINLSNLSSTGNDKFASAWVNFNGTGTIAIRDSKNVTSITDNGTGDYAVNFTTARADSNYSAVITAATTDASVPSGYNFIRAVPANRDTTSYRLGTVNAAGSAFVDAAVVSVVIHGGN